MKKIIFVLIVLTIISCNKEEKNYVLFSGKIENPNSNLLSIINSSNKKVREITVSDTGVFSDTIFDANGYFRFSDSKESSSIYLKDGYDITLNMNAKEFDETITYTGKGSNENNFLAQKYLTIEKYGSPTKLFLLEEANYLNKINDQKTELLNSLSSDLDNDFVESEKTNLKYDHILKAKQYERAHAYFTKNKDFKVSKNFPDLAKDLKYDNEKDYKTSSAYKNLVGRNFYKTVREKSEKDSIPFQEAAIAFIENVKSPEIKNGLLTSVARDVSSGNPKSGDLYESIMRLSTDEDFKTKLTEKYNLIKKLAKGSESPTFENYENYAGGTTSLNDLKGKYVYVDVWATWCGPCKREIPSLKKIEKQYHDKNIEFVSISIDVKKDHNLWTEMVKEKELTGVQLFSDNDWNSKFVKGYGINSIPRFILIDPDGKIINANAPRPSNKALIELFNELNI
ncbi:TlpA family protein disulfide reductase [Tenacibaculum sp. S7007]|uniref:TlpA family protein disulfide reductase n=1 Tax=Tenacibaculum pelagium TaxID=2759527 RepID=A0A839AP88_9FLAO|nr:TlpA disulfide reductase family protein [Tenacibaculum pelagium]MBA6156029.1 TlpA family protein disulfide reductase [Tenacibaculum pelagium]